MNQKTIIITVSIFVLIVAGMFTFAFLKRQEVATAPGTTPTATSTATSSDKYASITRINAKHFYIDGVHTLVGEIPMPTPCDLLESTSTVKESNPEQVVVDFSVVNHADYCAAVVTQQRFKVSAKAGPDATFTARFMGRPVMLNIVPAAPGETPDNFELFQKG